jgi:hypothetical protein
MPQEPQEQQFPPNTVQSTKKVDLALISYSDGTGQQVTQFAIVGDNSVLLLDSKELVGAEGRTPTGFATGWLKDGVLANIRR